MPVKHLSAWEAVRVVLRSRDSRCIPVLFKGPRDGQVRAPISGSALLAHRARERMRGYGC